MNSPHFHVLFVSLLVQTSTWHHKCVKRCKYCSAWQFFIGPILCIPFKGNAKGLCTMMGNDDGQQWWKHSWKDTENSGRHARFCWKFQLHFNGISKFPVDAIRRSAPYCLARAVRQQLYKQYAGLAFVFIYSFYCPLLRYLAVTQPLTYSKKWRCKRLALLMILGVWLLAFLITCPPLFGWWVSRLASPISIMIVCHVNQFYMNLFDLHKCSQII